MCKVLLPVPLVIFYMSITDLVPQSIVQISKQDGFLIFDGNQSGYSAKDDSEGRNSKLSTRDLKKSDLANHLVTLRYP